MVKIKSVEITVMHYVRGSLEAFLDGKKRTELDKRLHSEVLGIKSQGYASRNI